MELLDFYGMSLYAVVVFHLDLEFFFKSHSTYRVGRSIFTNDKINIFSLDILQLLKKALDYQFSLLNACIHIYKCV